MALRSCINRLVAKPLQQNIRMSSIAGGTIAGGRPEPYHGNRDVVGYGFNGCAMYYDRPDFPMSAIRFKENTNDVIALREKEMGDWSKLTISEKKALYRASFCQTYSEMMAPKGTWKFSMGIVLLVAGTSIWIYMGLKVFVYQPMPSSNSPEGKAKLLKRYIDMENEPIEGLASKYDYEKGQWK